jgi:hypothetical protein
MNSFLGIINNIYLFQIGRLRYACLYVALLAGSFVFPCLLSDSVTGLFPDWIMQARPVFFVLLIVVVLFRVGSSIASFIYGKELIFLKKNGVKNMALYLILVFKLRHVFIFFSVFYALIDQYDGRGMSLSGMAACFIGAALLFGILVFTVSLYFSLAHSLRNLSVVAILCVAVYWAANTMRSIDSLVSLTVQDVILSLSGSGGIVVLRQALISPGIFQFAIFILLLISIRAICVHRIFDLSKNNQTALGAFQKIARTFGSETRFPQPAVGTRPRKFPVNDSCVAKLSALGKTKKITPFKQFILRDIVVLLGYPVFTIFQIAQIAFSIYLFCNSHQAATKSFLAIAIFNTLFIQQIFEADSYFVAVYSKAPLSFAKFLGYRVTSALVIFSAIPITTFIMASICYRENAADFLWWTMAAFAVIVLYTFGFTGIMLYFFPETKKTDVPIIIGCFVPPFAIIAIPLGIRKGYRRWGEWDHYVERE